MTAARQQGNDRPRGIEIVHAAKLFAIVACPNFAGEWMAHKLDVVHSTFGIPIPLKRKNRKQQIDVALDLCSRDTSARPKAVD